MRGATRRDDGLSGAFPPDASGLFPPGLKHDGGWRRRAGPKPQTVARLDGLALKIEILSRTRYNNLGHKKSLFSAELSVWMLYGWFLFLISGPICEQS